MREEDRAGGGRLSASLLPALAVGGGVVAWQWLAGRQGCWIWMFPAAAWISLTQAFARTALLRRRCLLDCVFRAGSAWHRWLRGRVWLPLRSAVAAALFTLVLALEALTWAPWWTAWVLGGLPPLAMLFVYLGDTAPAVHPRWRRLFAAVVLSRGYAGIMLAGFAAVQFFSPPPVVLYPGLLDTVRGAREAAGAAACPYLAELLELRAEASAVGWWLAATGGAGLDAGWSRVLVWGGFLLSGGLAFLAIARLTLELAERLQGARPG